MKAITGFEGYFITNDGKVFSNKHHKQCNPNRELRELKLINHSCGYLCVNLVINKERHPTKVHRLVAEMFISNTENKREVNHINGIKTDNRVENLEWATSSENRQHAYNLGLIIASNGINHYISKLTEQQIILIRSDMRFHRVIAKEYGVSRSLISSIKGRKIWKHI